MKNFLLGFFFVYFISAVHANLMDEKERWRALISKESKTERTQVEGKIIGFKG